MLFQFFTFYSFSEFCFSPVWDTFTVNSEIYAITKGYVLIIQMLGNHFINFQTLYKVVEDIGAWNQKWKK